MYPFGSLDGFLMNWLQQLECYAVHPDAHA